MQVALSLYPHISYLVASKFEVSDASQGESVHSLRETQISGCYGYLAASFTRPCGINEHSNTNGILVSVKCDTPSLNKSEHHFYRAIMHLSKMSFTHISTYFIVTTFI